MKLMHSSRRHLAVKDLMARTLSAIDPRASLVDAAAAMRRLGVSSLAVLDDQVPLGIITERDLVRALSESRLPARTHVAEYMTRSPITVEIDERAAHAATLMEEHHVRHLLVTEHGRVAGCISARDLLRVQLWNAPVGDVEPW